MGGERAWGFPASSRGEQGVVRVSWGSPIGQAEKPAQFYARCAGCSEAGDVANTEGGGKAGREGGEACGRTVCDSGKTRPLSAATPYRYSENSSREGPGMVTAETRRPFLRTISAAAATDACTSDTVPAISM